MRRSVIGLMLTLAVLVTPLTVEAQLRGKIPRVGILSLSSAEASSGKGAFQQALRDLGYVEGQNIGFEWRWADGSSVRLRTLAGELVRLKVDVILAVGEDAIRAAQHATTTIPLVMGDVGDPVKSGFVETLAHPGGNLTGVTAIALELVEKQLELLKGVVPEVTRIGVLGTPYNLARHWPELEHAAHALDVQLQVLVVRGPEELTRAFELATRRGAGAVLMLPWVHVDSNERWIAELAVQSRLPTIYWHREFAEVGGFMAYGASRRDLARRAASYVDKILKGTKPADLPVEQPMKLELVLNLKTAQALGLTIPPTLLFQADEVIR